jgi:hypothetical protein
LYLNYRSKEFYKNSEMIKPTVWFDRLFDPFFGTPKEWKTGFRASLLCEDEFPFISRTLGI